MTDPFPRASSILWSRIEDGFHVGSRDGEFIGCVDRLKATVFEASDSRSQIIGEYATLQEALDAVTVAADAAPTTKGWF